MSLALQIIMKKNVDVNSYRPNFKIDKGSQKPCIWWNQHDGAWTLKLRSPLLTCALPFSIVLFSQNVPTPNHQSIAILQTNVCWNAGWQWHDCGSRSSLHSSYLSRHDSGLLHAFSCNIRSAACMFVGIELKWNPHIKLNSSLADFDKI